MPTLGAHQPNYIPWSGYFNKMALSDCFVLADDVQYSTQGYTNRTRIKTAQGAQWLTVPVLTKGRGLQLIREVRIDASRNWRRKHWKALCRNYAAAPYFELYAGFFDNLYRREWHFLADLNIHIIGYLRRVLGIEGPLCLSSELNIPPCDATGRIVQMAEKTGCARYISGRGGSTSYLREGAFREVGIELQYNDFMHPVYPQRFGEFISGLSVLDLLFNCGEAAAQQVCRPREADIVLEQL